MTDERPTHRVEVFLKNGVTLNTEAVFGEDEDPDEEIIAEIDSKTSRWKFIGDLTLWFEDITGFRTDPYANA